MKPRRWISALAGLALGLAIPHPCATTGAAPSHPLFLWKVTGGRGTVFLLGSIHAGRADLYPLPRPIEQAFNESAVVIEEISPDQQDPARLHRLMLERGLYPPGDRLDNHISAETKLAFQNYLQQAHQSFAMFSQMKPWLVTIMVSGSIIESNGISDKYGIDEHFAREAAAAHKGTDGLESAGFQLDLLSNVPEPLQDALLLSSLHEAQRGEREINTILAAWRAGNARRIEDLLSRDEREDPRLKPVYDALLPARNRRMAKKIAAYLATPKTTFVVVGVGHLLGPQGIVARLRAKGYKVERISSE